MLSLQSSSSNQLKNTPSSLISLLEQYNNIHKYLYLLSFMHSIFTSCIIYLSFLYYKSYFLYTTFFLESSSTQCYAYLQIVDRSSISLSRITYALLPACSTSNFSTTYPSLIQCKSNTPSRIS